MSGTSILNAPNAPASLTALETAREKVRLLEAALQAARLEAGMPNTQSIHETQGRYDANATPSTGQETLWDCYQALVSGKTSLERGDHAVF